MKFRKFHKGLYLCILALPVIGMAIGQGCGQFRAGDFLSNSSFGGGVYGFAPGEASGLRLLTVREYDAAVAEVFGETEKIGAALLPGDNFEPFDNFTEDTGAISDVRVRAYESAAREIVTRLLASNNRLSKILPCTPQGVNDANCFTQIIQSVGSRAFRRPLTEDEVQRYLAVTTDFAQRGSNYRTGLEVLFSLLLQHPAFIYRWEVGEPVDGNQNLFKLNDFELASRLSFTLWGTPPDQNLLDAAAQGLLSDEESYLQIVNSMIEDERARKHIDFFHAAWFGYSGLGDQGDLQRDMRAETRALLERIVFNEDKPWREVLTSRETFVTAALAQHYGAPTPSNASGAWITYPETSQRRGLFGQGSFLAVGAKFGDTSPTQRGYNIRKHVFCEMVNPPPPGVDVDTPPGDDTPSNCKEDKHYASTLRPGSSCISCHQLMDTIGFGLEHYDALGAFRTAESTAPECKISGQGEAFGYGAFNGPAELAQVALTSGRVERCLVERWVQFSYGKRNDTYKREIVDKNYFVFQESGRLKDFIRNFVTSEDFKYRRVGE